MPIPLLAMALLALLLSALCGALGILYYLPGTGAALEALGLLMPQLRALHTTFALAWIYLAAIAFIDHHFLGESPANPPRSALWKTGFWAAAGVAAFASLAMGVFSGREYLEYHPLISVFIFCGMACFACEMLRRVRRNFWEQPVYMYMWTIGPLLFLYAYAESHLWLFDWFFSRPVADMQLQWKSVGMLAGSYNLLVYGIAMALGERLGASRAYGRSRLAFFLFFVGLLNSFTNYTHHTYHLPQSHLMKWIAFGVSMLECLILLKLLVDLWASRRKPDDCSSCLAASFLASSRWWTFLNLSLAILISIPPLNALIHGTQVVMAHAMGSMIGIDSTVLLAASFHLACRNQPRRSFATPVFHGALALLVSSLSLLGAAKGVSSYLGTEPPAWTGLLLPLIIGSGLALALALAHLSAGALRCLLGRRQPQGLGGIAGT